MQGHEGLQEHAASQSDSQFAESVRPMDDRTSKAQRAKAAILSEVALAEAIDS
jgi:hypothetical protein